MCRTIWNCVCKNPETFFFTLKSKKKCWNLGGKVVINGRAFEEEEIQRHIWRRDIISFDFLSLCLYYHLPFTSNSWVVTVTVTVLYVSSLSIPIPWWLFLYRYLRHELVGGVVVRALPNGYRLSTTIFEQKNVIVTPIILGLGTHGFYIWTTAINFMSKYLLIRNAQWNSYSFG